MGWIGRAGSAYSSYSLTRFVWPLRVWASDGTYPLPETATVSLSVDTAAHLVTGNTPAREVAGELNEPFYVMLRTTDWGRWLSRIFFPLAS